MNRADKIDFSNDSPKKCNVKDCNNKPFAKDYLTRTVYVWVCRKHYNEFCRGIVK